MQLNYKQRIKLTVRQTGNGFNRILNNVLYKSTNNDLHYYNACKKLVLMSLYISFHQLSNNFFFYR